ncbi:MAG TPA: nuclear transport factor 2 family protein [Asticcacaulis sp.]|nr:nuclear transport factor 2 family protein [Asticcacaulis sp.]
MTPEQVVKMQLDAYNAKDIEAFMTFWHVNARIFAHPDTLLCDGHAAIRERHVSRFREPDLHARLIDRFLIGERVVDRECVVRNFPEGVGEIDVLAIYEIDGERIARAWFLSGEPRLR